MIKGAAEVAGCCARDETEIPQAGGDDQFRGEVQYEMKMPI